jgi:hypothetical protein
MTHKKRKEKIIYISLLVEILYIRKPFQREQRHNSACQKFHEPCDFSAMANMLILFFLFSEGKTEDNLTHIFNLFDADGNKVKLLLIQHRQLLNR